MATLEKLQYQHLLHVPFENLDIWNRIPIELDTAVFYDKIVNRRRGGYCYECNGLFHALLLHLGFQSRMISCRVANGKKLGQEFDHLALIVTLGKEEWLVDVGFGDFSVKPLLLGNSDRQYDGRSDYRFTPHKDDDGRLYTAVARSKHTTKRFSTVYIFRDTAYALADFEGMNQYQQTSPDSHFTRQLICSKLTETGRISLIGNRLVTTLGTEKEERLLYGPDACNEVLEKTFGMHHVLPDTAYQSA